MSLLQGDVNEWNNKTAEITGYTKEEAWNKPLVSTFIVASLRQSVQEVLDNALQGRETSNYELEFRTKSNEIRYLLVNATTRRDPHNNIVGVVGVAQASTFLLYPFGPLAVLTILFEFLVFRIGACCEVACTTLAQTPRLLTPVIKAAHRFSLFYLL